MKTLTPMYRQLSLAVKYSSVLFPFDTLLFLKALAQQGFIIPEAIGRPVPHGARLQVSGIVARKADISVRIDPEAQIMGVLASDIDSLRTEMDSVESLLKNELDFDSSSLCQYYEFLAGLTMRATRNPLESWATHFSAVPMLKNASEALGTKISPFGVRLSPSGEIPNQANWFEIRIEPLVESAMHHHNIEVVFRHAERYEVFAFVQKFEHYLATLMSIVEEG